MISIPNNTPRQPCKPTAIEQRATELHRRRIRYIASQPQAASATRTTGDRSDTATSAAATEAALFRRMNQLKQQAVRLREELDPRQPSAQRMDQIERLLNEATAVRNRLVCSYQRLVTSIAVRYVGPRQPLDELISEGNATLIMAVEQFDADRGFRFSTYATHAIRRALFKAFERASRQRQRVSGVPVESLVLPAGRSTGTVCEEQRMASLLKAVDGMISCLDHREACIIRARYGLDSCCRRPTLACLAEQFGVSRERIRQLEHRALDRLRSMARQQKLEWPEW